MRKKYKLVCGLMATSLVITSLTACGKSSASDTKTTTAGSESQKKTKAQENTFTYADESQDAPVSETITGTVQSVDDNEITLSIGGGAGQVGGTPPEMPSGDNSSSNSTDNGSDKSGGTPPEMPSGDNSSDNGADNGAGKSDSKQESQTAVLTVNDESVITVSGTDGKSESGSLSDIKEGTMLSITFDEDGVITEIAVSQSKGMAGGGMPGGSSSGVDSYDAVTEYSEDTSVENTDYTSTGNDENAILVSDGAEVTLKNIKVDRTSSDSTGGDNSSFYGVGAAVLTTDGTTCISDADITTDAAGGAGVFAYGDGTVYIADSDISTKQNTSGGIHAAGGGTLYAWNLNVETDGESAAAIRSDRGGGTMVVDGGTYTSNGTGSPAVYCTADIAVNSATLTANGSEAICMEGLNTIHLFDCDITGNMQDLSQNDTTWTIIVYQSMSGDSEVGNSTMQIVGGSITSENGGLIYTTNTECDILLSDVDITYADDSEFFLMCTGNANERGWGTTGSNGSQCKFTADSQEMKGDVIWDSISELDFYMTNGSSLTGAFTGDETYAGNGGSGYCNVYISSDSKWTVTGNSTVTNLYNAGTIVDESGNTVSVVGTDGTVYVTGTGSYTITVTSYSTTADLSQAAAADTWSAHEVAKPEELN